MVRSIACSESRPDWATPSPSRTIREKASTTRKPLPLGPRDKEPAVVRAEVERAE